MGTSVSRMSCPTPPRGVIWAGIVLISVAVFASIFFSIFVLTSAPEVTTTPEPPEEITSIISESLEEFIIYRPKSPQVATRPKSLQVATRPKLRLDTLSKASSSFSLDLFRVVADQNKMSNIFLSPLSVSSALAMVLLGARGNTAAQISQCLEFRNLTDVHSSFASLLQRLQPSIDHLDYSWMDNHKSDLQNLSVANRLYGEQYYQFVQDFIEETRQYYSAELETVDFFTKPEEARVHINTWVEEQTEGKIKDALAEGSIDNQTKLALVNAIYFQAKWVKFFSDANTGVDKFRVNKYDTRTVQMMHTFAKFEIRQIEEIWCQVIELPYRWDSSMFIFLPYDIEDNTTGLEQLEKHLTYENFVEWTRQDKMSELDVYLDLPRFRIEGNYDLINVLKVMGVTDAFDPSKCDFSGMSLNDLVLSRFAHKTVVNVDEHGTEAAAASIGVMEPVFASTPVHFNADHPFIFFIRHKYKDTVLFAGRFSSPE